MTTSSSCAIVAIFGTDSADFGCSCEHHPICGRFIDHDAVFRLKRMAVASGKCIFLPLFCCSITHHCCLTPQFETHMQPLLLLFGSLKALTGALLAMSILRPSPISSAWKVDSARWSKFFRPASPSPSWTILQQTMALFW